MIVAENGVNPLDVDPTGFRARLRRRIELDRTWVLRKKDKGQNPVIFKANVIAMTPEVFYLEGIYVAPDERGKGWGLRCLSQLTRQLLAETGRICLFVNEQNVAAQKLYRKANFKQRSRYRTIIV